MIKMNKVFAVVMLVMMVVFMITSVVKAVGGVDDIEATVPDTRADFRDITQGGGKLITMLFNIFAVFFIGMAGMAMVQLVGGHLQQNSMVVTHARSALTYAFIGLASLALIPKLAGIILTTFGFNFKG
jgi:hypothetical protein